MSRIDIAELNGFLQELRSSNAEAKKMIRGIQQAASKYTQDKSLKGQGVSASQSYFASSYPSIAQSILEALEESEERLAQYIREFGSQVDSSPSARIDAEVLQEAMAKVASLQRKEEDLHRQLTAPNTKPDMQQVYVVQARSAHTQLLQAIQKEDILERYIAFEQSHAHFFSALIELIHSTGRAVQELKQNVTFHDKTGTYAVPKSVHASISLMKKAMDKARKENAKDPFPEAFEDYHLFAYTYVNDKGETVTMWLLERDGKRASNKELQAFLEEHGAELDPILYTSLSGEELERKVNDAWKDGVNYLNGQKVTGFSGATLRSSAYVASVKDAMDDAGLTDMALGLGFGIAAARNNLKATNTKKVKTNFDAENPVSGKEWNNYFKEKYGSANVRWKDPIKSINDAIDMPSLLSGTNPEDIVEIAIREGWIVQPLKKGSKSGLLFSEGGGYSMNALSGSSLYIQYHPGGGHHGQGAYYKVSSPKNGTIRINIEGGVLE
ncbi:T7SS effector LXG polymorphic toxin [Listeria cossartiae subsp. cayugensis]|uniref:T7SS effector LXG polymorphic toxin n=1 Tax=Listeria cossartiae TaxID=2838249 RepID=UPI00288005B0|nr:T7SS effector LXG polymorphic toxin [Listeria cossartiae]MDT0001454.1 T7SS effector LXG polymorphic toxin [Listeria cossartiae subsp. cayugensis]MDT0009324.1 T7SS effector LXG polymorphic toxin [Listeria cossartiae subsp. cayugensis]MDT0031484.1 T7SS effector LXG polymorphic toxin [Listeria cossartiae subsp. cayugensis]MDT0039600.1 T7SS effector LXG polymorphic toxin [Listeria cossartiae subsp. cayugensis]MDT0044621.1 T7SS effector LXG polymorphic toxin [Listeria cossartiae subsp. cayugensi